MPSIPYVHALLVCEHVWQEIRTGKWHACGIFSRVEAENEPLRLDPFAVYVNLTGLHGSYRFEFQILRATDERLVVAMESLEELEVADPLATIDFGVPVGVVELPSRGKYLLRLRVNGRDLENVVFLVP